MLPKALELITAWGFTFKTVGFYWAKTNKRAKLDKLFRERWGRFSVGQAPSDHSTLYRVGKGFALVSHFYDFEHVYRRMFDSYAAAYPRLFYEVDSSFPSWWNPPSTTMVIWRERGAT